MRNRCSCSRFRRLCLLVALCLALPAVLPAQNLRYDNHREVRPPEDATMRLGPFYSSWLMSLSAGYRYVETTGTGTDYLFSTSRGRIKDDGSDLPLIASFGARNYLIIDRHTDLDVSVFARYEYYPLDTQESEWTLYFADEGLTARLSMEMQPLPYMRATLYDQFIWRTDYVDTRGIEDRYGGLEHEYILNTVGVDTDWLMTGRDNLALSGRRIDSFVLEGDFEEQEYVKHAGDAAWEHRLTDYAVAGVRGGLEHTAYDTEDRPDSLLQRYDVFAQVALTERSVAAGSLGYSIGSTSSGGDAESDEKYDTVIGSASLATKLSRRLSHSLRYERGQKTGFDAAFETYQDYGYKIDWKGERTAIGGYTRYHDVDPSAEGLNGYSDWVSGIDVSHGLLPYLTLLGSTRYSVRDNEATTAPGVDEELSEDYDTWASRLGTSLMLLKGPRSDVKFATYVEHIERYSDAATLEYTRDIFSALLDLLTSVLV